MLYWHFRNLQCILIGLLGSKLNPTTPVTHTFWANIFDTDWFNSVQAGRFFTYSDAARWIIAVRMGFLKLAFQKKLVIIIGGQKITYRRPVRLFRKFSITMRIMGWDEKWMYIAHVFRQKGQLCAVSYTKAGFRSQNGLYSPVLAVQQLGHGPTPPPEWVLKLFREDVENLQQAERELVEIISTK